MKYCPDCEQRNPVGGMCPSCMADRAIRDFVTDIEEEEVSDNPGAHAAELFRKFGNRRNRG